LSVKIRLTRKGRKKIAFYRIVVTDSRFSRDGRFLETLGYYNPQTQPKEFKLNVERIGYWLKNGAEPSVTVKNLLKQDHFNERLEAIEKGLDAANSTIVRKSERKERVKSKVKAKKEGEKKEG